MPPLERLLRVAGRCATLCFFFPRLSLDGRGGILFLSESGSFSCPSDRSPSLIRRLPRRRRVGPQESGKNHEARPFSISRKSSSHNQRADYTFNSFFLTNSTVSCLTGSGNGDPSRETSACEESETRGERVLVTSEIVPRYFGAFSSK